MGTSSAKERFASQLLEAGLPKPERNYRLEKGRRWRFDFAWPAEKHKALRVRVPGGGFAVEIVGSVKTGSRYEARRKKLNAATLSGWIVYHVTPQMVKNGKALVIVRYQFGEITLEEWESEMGI